jgi:hypothetical protein
MSMISLSFSLPVVSSRARDGLQVDQPRISYYRPLAGWSGTMTAAGVIVQTGERATNLL